MSDHTNPEDPVRLRLAFSWVCPNCFDRNFILPQPVNLSKDSLDQALRSLHDLEDWQEIPDEVREDGVAAVPNHVECESCKSVSLVEMD